MNAEEVSLLLATKQPWREAEDGFWLDDPDLAVERMAQRLLEAGARLATITALPAPGGEARLVYHWDIEGTLFNLGALTRGGKIPSIAPGCPAADWIEREVNDYFGVVFTGRDDLAPLVLRQGDRPGVFFWNGSEAEGDL